MKHIHITNKQDCCGCTACAAICPHDAIEMVPDGLGFLYPEVDETKCVDCGLCVSTCAFRPDYPDPPGKLPATEAYGARHKDRTEMERSQSGAAFVALSDWVLEQGGVVYGVGYEGHFRAVHKRVATREERDEFRGSKYVQSDPGEMFRQVRNDLKQGLTVCVSGTPCQIAGLRAFIPKRLQERLFLVDLICHGVPGPKIWADYLDYLERKAGRKISHVNFRDKSLYGWRSHVETFRYGDTYTYTYTYTFYSHIALRKSCHVCPFTNTRRTSDLTIGDFWGVEKTDMQFAADNKGCSLILINTEKGRQWFDAVKERFDLLAAPLGNCLQPQLRHPTVPHPRRDDFETDYERMGFERTMRKYGFIGWKAEAKKYAGKAKRAIKKIIKPLIGKK